jgi:hypothetical protein
MFPTKAVAIWIAASEPERLAMVEHYFVDSGVFRDIQVIDKSLRPGPPSDPVYAVIGKRRGD